MPRPKGKKDSKPRKRRTIDPQEKKVTVPFQIKRKHVKAAKKIIQPIVDKINKK